MLALLNDDDENYDKIRSNNESMDSSALNMRV